jgi:hypothetical protein
MWKSRYTRNSFDRQVSLDPVLEGGGKGHNIKRKYLTGKLHALKGVELHFNTHLPLSFFTSFFGRIGVVGINPNFNLEPIF